MKHPGARRRPGRERAVACSAASAFAAGWVLTAVSELITTQSFADAAALLFGFTPRAVATAAFLGLVICTLGFLCRSIFAGGLVVTLSVAGLSFANYYKMLITSTPLYVQDIRLVTQVGGIMELNEASMKFSGESAAAVAVMLLVLVGSFSPRGASGRGCARGSYPGSSRQYCLRRSSACRPRSRAGSTARRARDRRRRRTRRSSTTAAAACCSASGAQSSSAGRSSSPSRTRRS